MTVPVFVPLLLATPDVLSLLFGASFVAASTALRILLLGQLIHISVGLVYTLLMMAGGEGLWVRLSGFAAALGIALPILLIPRFGIVGAATSTMLTTVFLMGTGLWAVRMQLGISPYDVRSLFAVLCAIASSLAVLVVRLLVNGHPGLEVVLVFAASISATALVLIKYGLHTEDRELLVLARNWARRDSAS